MTQRSNSTVERDHRRAIEHKVYLELQELSTIDWNSVEEYEVQEYLDLLNELESECENEQLCEQISELISQLEEQLD